MNRTCCQRWSFSLIVASVMTVASTPMPVAAETPSGWLAHDMQRPRPPVVQPAAISLPVPPPADARILFDGGDLDQWRSADGTAPRWIIRDGYMESVPNSGYLYSADGFGDLQLHVEWAAPKPAQGMGQGRGNSGVFLMGKYEVQVLDSYQNDTYPDGQAGAIYGQYPPLVNVCRPPGEWQSFDIVFRRPRFDQQGVLQRSARMTVHHNGVLIHDARELWGPTSWLQHAPYSSHPDRLPIGLQDHGNPVRYRNIWLRELRELPAPAEPSERPYVTLSSEQLDRMVGIYGREDEFQVQVTREQNGLRAQMYGRQLLELVPSSPTEFFLRWTAGRIVFRAEDTGVASALELHLGGRTYTAGRLE